MELVALRRGGVVSLMFVVQGATMKLCRPRPRLERMFGSNEGRDERALFDMLAGVD